MSKLAYDRFMNRRMLTGEEQQHKEELITIIEQVLSQGKECDERIGKMGHPELLEILGAARILRTGFEERRFGQGATSSQIIFFFIYFLLQHFIHNQIVELWIFLI